MCVCVTGVVGTGTAIMNATTVEVWRVIRVWPAVRERLVDIHDDFCTHGGNYVINNYMH